MDTTVQNHDHNGINSKQLSVRSLEKVPQVAISDPTGGAVIDIQARAQLVLILDAMREIGLIRE